MKHIKIYLFGCLAFIGSIVLPSCSGKKQQVTQTVDTIALANCPSFEKDSAMKYIVVQCDFGPRVPQTPAAQACGDYLIEQFQKYGTLVQEQVREVTIYDGSKVTARNIIAQINPNVPKRILLCAHWDSRPWADNDPNPENHLTPVPAANDGASGVAVMMEIARLIQQQPIQMGLDLICFDVEDMGTPQWAELAKEDQETWCLGSEVWAQEAYNQGYMAQYGILLDMVGGRGCTFSREQVSMQYAGPIVDLVWKLAGQLGFRHYFPLRNGGFLMDDHVNVNVLAGIPCIDIVPHFTEGPSNFGPTWHTLQDTPENIDPQVLHAVGQTLVQLIYNENKIYNENN